MSRESEQVEMPNNAHLKPAVPKKLEDDLADFGHDLWVGNLARLIRNFENKTTNFASFTGAGVSTPLGIDDWDHLLFSLMREAGDSTVKDFKVWGRRESGYPSMEDFKSLCRGLPDNERKIQISSDFYLDFAEELCDALGGESKFQEKLSSRLEQSTASTSLSLIHAAICFRQHFTTNFDNSIREAYSAINFVREHILKNDELRTKGSKREAVEYLIDDTDGARSQKEDCIYYLHRRAKGNRFVIARRHYVELYKPPKSVDSRVYQLLNRYCNSHSFVFIGFSFSDSYFQDCWRDVWSGESIESRKGTREPRHYLLIHEGSPLFQAMMKRTSEKQADGQRFNDHFQEIGIKPIVYVKDKHIFVQRLLESLLNNSIRHRSPDRNDSAGNVE